MRVGGAVEEAADHEVVGEVLGGRDAHRSRREGDQLPLGVERVGNRRFEHRPWDHALGQIVELLDPAPARHRDPARDHQTRHGALSVAPRPTTVVLAPATALHEVGRRDRPAGFDLGEHGGDERWRHPPQSVLPARVRSHPPTEERVERGGDERRRVTEVLEQLVTFVRERVERADRIRAEPRVHRQVLRPREHADRIDLEDVDTRRDAPDVGDAELARRTRGREALGRQREPTRLGRREVGAGPRSRGTWRDLGR